MIRAKTTKPISLEIDRVHKMHLKQRSEIKSRLSQCETFVIEAKKPIKMTETIVTVTCRAQLLESPITMFRS